MKRLLGTPILTSLLAGLLLLAPRPCRADDRPLALSDLSLSYYEGALYPDTGFLGTSLYGYDLRLGWLTLDWGPSPGDDLAFAPTRGHLMLYMSRDFAGMELIPPFHWEQAYILLEPRAGMDRCMVARRYEIETGRWTLGYVEAALLSGEFSPWYLNPYPLIPLEVTQLVLQFFETEGGRNDYCNMTMAIDARYDGERTSWYASFLADDLPPTSVWASHYKIGLQAGLEYRDPLGWRGATLWLEYTAITRHTFSFYADAPQGDYVDGDLFLGHPLGPDADLVTAQLTWPSGTWVALQRERHGEGRFPDPHEPVTGQTLEFLTGVVESSYWLKGGHVLTLGGRLRLDLELGAAYVENLDNITGQTGMRYDLSVVFTYQF